MDTKFFLFMHIVITAKALTRRSEPQENIETYSAANSMQTNLSLEAILSKPNVSQVVSPFFLRFPLCKLASVAEGTAKKELISALGITRSQIKHCYSSIKESLLSLRGADLTLANKIFASSSNYVDRGFTYNITEQYGIRFETVDFSLPKLAMASMGNWANAATLGRLPPSMLTPYDIDKYTSMFILNAAHMTVTWKKFFNLRKTRLDSFYMNKNKAVMVPMMKRLGKILYFKDTNNSFEKVTLDINNPHTTMTILIPKDIDGLPKLLMNISKNPGLIKSIPDMPKYLKLVELSLPRFKVKTSITWDEHLKKMGVNQIFNRTSSGLDRMLKEIKGLTQNISLSKVMQKNYIEIDEFGHYKPVNIAPDSYEENLLSTVKLSANRPFLFTIHLGAKIPNSKESGSDEVPTPASNVDFIVFVGVYYGPGTE